MNVFSGSSSTPPIRFLRSCSLRDTRDVSLEFANRSHPGNESTPSVQRGRLDRRDTLRKRRVCVHQRRKGLDETSKDLQEGDKAFLPTRDIYMSRMPEIS